MRRATRAGSTGALLMILLIGLLTAAAGLGRPVTAAVPIGAQGISRPYDVGKSDFVELYVNPVLGNDENNGDLPEQAVRTLRTAWQRMVQFPAPEGLAYRINLQPGFHRFDPINRNTFNYIGHNGTFQRPIVIRAEFGPGTVTVSGGLEFVDISYLYLQDLKISLVDQDAAKGGTLLRFRNCDHILVRNCEIDGPNPALPEGDKGIDDAVRFDNCQYVYVERCNIHGASEAGVRMSTVQYGHLLKNRIHEAGDWAVQLQGGSAYLRVDSNEIYDSTQAFLAGGESNFELMRSPWLHYEVYDVKFVNNLVHDVPGLGLGVAGGFNVLLAYNTLHRVGIYHDGLTNRGYPLMAFTHGGRFCAESPLNGTNNATAKCAERLAEGGWGTTDPAAREPIPNRRVYVYNNVFYNPSPTRTRYSHLSIEGPVAPPTVGSNIPTNLHADTSLEIVGNLIWNGPASLPLGVEGASAAQIRRDNRINTLQPQLANPAQGDLRPRPNGNLVRVPTAIIPGFAFFFERPTQPPVPLGDDDNHVPEDYSGEIRSQQVTPGAHYAQVVPPYTASGTIWGPFAQLPGVKLTFQVVSGNGVAPAPVVSDKTGVWTRPNIQPFVLYRVTPTLSGYKFKPAYLEFSEARTDLDFTAEVDGYTIFGFVGDRQVNAINGVNILFRALTGRRGAPDPVQTDVTGLFTAAGLRRGTKYRATPSLPGWRFTPASRIFSREGTLLQFQGRRIR